MSMGTSVDIVLNVYMVGSEMVGWVYARRQRIEITRRRNRGSTHNEQPASVVEGRERDRVSNQARIVCEHDLNPDSLQPRMQRSTDGKSGMNGDRKGKNIDKTPLRRNTRIQ